MAKEKKNVFFLYVGKATACFNHDGDDHHHQQENEKRKKRIVCARLYIYSKID
jgi:hypothetical protein